MASAAGTSFCKLPIACPSKQNQAASNPSRLSFSAKGISYSSLGLKSNQCRFRVSCAAKPETVDKVCHIVKKQLALKDDVEVSGQSTFAGLGADSLDTVEIVMGLEEEFGITVKEESAQAITSVQEAADLIENLVETKAV